MDTAAPGAFTDESQYQRLLRGLREARSAQLWDVRLNTRRAVQSLCARLERDLSIDVVRWTFDGPDRGQRSDRWADSIRECLASFEREAGYLGDRIYVLDFVTVSRLDAAAMLGPLVEFGARRAAVLERARGSLLFVPPAAFRERLFNVPALYWSRTGEVELHLPLVGLSEAQLGARRAYLRSFFPFEDWGAANDPNNGSVHGKLDLTELASRAVLDGQRELAMELLERAVTQYERESSTHGPDLREAEYRWAAAMLWFGEDLRRAGRLLIDALRRARAAGDHGRRVHRGQVLAAEIFIALAHYSLAESFLRKPTQLGNASDPPAPVDALDLARSSARLALIDARLGHASLAIESLEEACAAWETVLEREQVLSVNHECERAALLRLAAAVAEASGDAGRAGRWRGRFVAAQDHLARVGVAIDD
ncbi:MAG: hypothetical protein U0269_00350 [Polyangiales bacterium]